MVKIGAMRKITKHTYLQTIPRLGWAKNSQMHHRLSIILIGSGLVDKQLNGTTIL